MEWNRFYPIPSEMGSPLAILMGMENSIKVDQSIISAWNDNTGPITNIMAMS